MASRYGIDTDNWRYADNSPVTSGRGRQANMLNAGLAAYQAVRGFQGDQADSEAADAAKAAQQEQTQLGPETSSQKGSQYYDQDQSGGPADGNYVMNAAGRQGYNEDGSDMTAAQTAMEDRGVAPTYKQQYGLGASPTTFRDTQYTPAEKRTAGLQARADFYAGDSRIGSADKAEKYSGMLEDAQDRGLRRKQVEGELAMQPLQQQAAAQTLETGRLTQNQLRGEIAARPEIAALTTTLDGLKAGTPEYAAARSKLVTAASAAYPPQIATQIISGVTSMSAASRTERQAVIADKLHDALLLGKPGLIKFYAGEMPDDFEAKEVPVKGGGFKLVQYNPVTKATGATIGIFKDDKDFTIKAMMKAPTLLGTALTLQERRDEKDTWADVTKAVAQHKASRGEYQTNSFATVATLESGEPVVQNRADGRLQVQGEDGKMRPLTGSELKKVGLTQKTSGEKPGSDDAEWDAELKRFSSGQSSREEFTAAKIARDARVGKPLFPASSNNTGGGPRAPGSEARPLSNSQPAGINSGRSNWGALTSWRDVVQGMKDGDEGAWKYAERRVDGGPGFMGVNPPDEVLGMLDKRKRDRAGSM